MKNLVILAFLAVQLTASAQTYIFSQTTSTYANLSGETVLTTTAPWTYATSFTVPIGFTFNFMGTNFTSVYVEGSGFAYFDFNYYNLALPFTVKLKSKGSSGNNSPISYKTEGVSPNRILKVQWKNAGFHYDTTSTINFQMWLHESSNIVEVHVGSNSVPNPAVVYQENGSDGPVIGVYKYSSATNCTNSTCLNGNASAPVFNNLTGNINLFGTSITGTPASGTVYVFDPNVVGISETATTAFSIGPNPASDRVMIITSDNSIISECRIFSLSGALICTRKPEDNFLDVSDLAVGIYLVEVESEGVVGREKLVVVR